MKLLHAAALPSQSGHLVEYRLDRNTANYFADKSAWRLMPVDRGTKPLSAFKESKVTLNGNAAYMLLISN